MLSFATLVSYIIARFSDVYKHSMRHCSRGKYSSEENQGETHNSDVSRNTSLSCRPSLRNRHNTTDPVNSAGDGDDEDPEKPTSTNIKKQCEVVSNIELFYDTFESTPDKICSELETDGSNKSKCIPEVIVTDVDEQDMAEKTTPTVRRLRRRSENLYRSTLTRQHERDLVTSPRSTRTRS